jgi:hypothetical protein
MPDRFPSQPSHDEHGTPLLSPQECHKIDMMEPEEQEKLPADLKKRWLATASWHVRNRVGGEHLDLNEIGMPGTTMKPREWMEFQKKADAQKMT